MAINDTNTAGNNNFWLNMAAESIYSSAEKRTKSVESLKTVIIWAFALFSAGGFMVTLFGELKEFHLYALLSFGLAFFLLTVAYVQAGRAQYPIVNKYNAAEVSEIKTALSTVVETQALRFKWASGITSVGFFFVALGILIQFGTLKKIKEVKKENKEPLSIFIKTGIEKKADSVFIPVTLHYKKNEPVDLSFLNTTKYEKQKKGLNRLIINRIFYTDSAGWLYYSHYLNPTDSIKNLTIRATARQSIVADTTMEQSAIVNLALKK